MLFVGFILVAVLSPSSNCSTLQPNKQESFATSLLKANFSDGVLSAYSADSFLSAVLSARRIANCLQEYGGPVEGSAQDLLLKPYQCTKSSTLTKCNECLGTVKTHEESSTDQAYDQVGYKCKSSENRNEHQQNGIFKSVDVFCEAFEADLAKPEKFYQNYAILKWGHSDLTSTPENASALVFVVEEIRNNRTKWRLLTQTLHLLSAVKLSNHKPGNTYQWRVTAVSDGGIEDCITTQVFIPTLGEKRPGPPLHVSVADQQRNSNHTVNVLVKWDPSKEKTCEYKIMLDKEIKSSLESVEVVRIKEPTGTHSHWFTNLEMDKSYNVRVTSRASHLNFFESTATQLDFKTKSCFELYTFDLTICAPPKPVGLQAKNIFLANSTDTPALELEWLPPTFENDANYIDEYLIEMRPLLPAPQAKRGGSAWTIRVPGNKTKEVVRGNISTGTGLLIALRAKSKGGISPAAYLHFTSFGYKSEPNTTYMPGKTLHPNGGFPTKVIAITLFVLGVGVVLIITVWSFSNIPQTEINEMELQEHLEKVRVVHRDVACRNVLLMSGCFDCKVGDFGMSRDIYVESVYQSKQGFVPAKWTAIEGLEDGTYTTKSDVWSYGILLWELMTLGSTPYKNVVNKEIFCYLISGGRLSKPDYCPQEMFSLMESCWKTDRQGRPSFREILMKLDAMQMEPNECN